MPRCLQVIKNYLHLYNLNQQKGLYVNLAQLMLISLMYFILQFFEQADKDNSENDKNGYGRDWHLKG